MYIRFALVACLVSISNPCAADCESDFREKSWPSAVLPKFGAGPLKFTVQPLFDEEIKRIDEAWMTQPASSVESRSIDFLNANQEALGKVRLGKASLVRASLNGPQAVISVPNVDELCALIKQQRIVRIWPEGAMVAPVLAPLSTNKSR